MNFQRWFLPVVAAASAACATLLIMSSARRRMTAAQVGEQRGDVHSWENEGGNLAPVPAPGIST